MNHLIQRQILELVIPEEKQAFELQREASDIFQRKVLPRLGEVFDRLNVDNRWVSIDKMELDIGKIHVSDWENELPQKIVATFEKWISEHQNLAIGRENSSNIVIQTHEAHVLMQFQYFLKRGYLPSHTSISSFSNWKKTILRVFRKEGEVRDQKTVRQVLQNQNALKRVLREFDEEFQKALFAWIGLEINEGLQRFYQWLKEQHLPLLPFWEIVLKEDLPSFDIVAKAVFETYLIKKKASISDLLLKLDPSSQTVKKLEPSMHRQLLQTLEALEQKGRKGKGSSDIQGMYQANKVNTSSNSYEAIPKEGLYIENAGLVLISPFIPALFSNLGLSTQREIVSPERGIYLLQYLLNGEAEMPEYDLVLNKILCGFPLEESPEITFLPTEKEAYEVEDLLTSLIAHWGALKNTSSDGLREAFLRREGKLMEDPENWTLIVEQKDYDLLLDKVPWSYSVVKLPWMHKKMIVEWV